MTDRDSAAASRAVLSFAPDDEWTATALGQPSYRAYLRRTRAGPVSPETEWEEFVSGGCGSTRDVILRVERLVEGEAIGSSTEFDFVPRSTRD